MPEVLPLDTLIFLLLFGTLLSMRTEKRWLTLVLFGVSLAAILLLFRAHATSTLDLNF